MGLKLEIKILIVLFVLFFAIHINTDYTLILEENTTYSNYTGIDVNADYIVRQIHSKNSSLGHDITNISRLEDLVFQEELEKKNKDFEKIYVETKTINKTKWKNLM